MTTLEQVLAYINNYFVVDTTNGKFKVENNHLVDVDFLQTNQYYRIVGSIFNDGVYKYGAEENMTDELFDGKIQSMAIPKAVISTCGEIDAWLTKYGDVQNSPYMSESFGGYSYSKASSGFGNSNKSTSVSWQSIFSSKLNQWRKL